jgi:tetracycline resistance efflux pump
MDLETFGWLSLAPPLLAIGLAVASRRAASSLLVGVWVGWVVATGDLFRGTAATVDSLIAVFADAGQTRVVVFTLLMGPLLLLLQQGGGVGGLLEWVGRSPRLQTRRGARLLATALGLGVFVESTITCLVVGAVAKPIFDRLGIAREKLAYLCDATSAPVCMLIPINSWGAVVLSLLATQATFGTLDGQSPLTVFLIAVPLNFYAVLSVGLAVCVAATGWDVGPMQEAERRAREEGNLVAAGARPVVSSAWPTGLTEVQAPPSAPHLIVPLVTLVTTVVAGIAATGVSGAHAAGIGVPTFLDVLDNASGSTAVLWGVIAALCVSAVMLTSSRVMAFKTLADVVHAGVGTMVPIATLLILAFGIGAVCTTLGTGPYIANVVTPYLTPVVLAPLVFVTAGAMAFATGTSWGTFAIMIPLALPVTAAMLGDGAAVSIPLVVSAVLGGGVFGDHCSPISDTTLISSMAAGSDHIDHVRTQLPYALAAGAASLLLYLAAGLLV